MCLVQVGLYPSQLLPLPLQLGGDDGAAAAPALATGQHRRQEHQGHSQVAGSYVQLLSSVAVGI